MQTQTTGFTCNVCSFLGLCQACAFQIKWAESAWKPQQLCWNTSKRVCFSTSNCAGLYLKDISFTFTFLLAFLSYWLFKNIQSFIFLKFLLTTFSCTTQMAVMIFKRSVFETRRKPKGLLRPKTRSNLKDAVNVSLTLVLYILRKKL